MPRGIIIMSPDFMMRVPISVSHFSAPLTQKMISCASLLRCQKLMSCLRRFDTSMRTRLDSNSRSGVPSALSMLVGVNASENTLMSLKISAYSTTPELVCVGLLSAPG